MSSRWSACAAIALVLAFASSAVVDAQYFGRNKVEYKDFHFRILATEHFDVYFYEREERAARIAARMAERWYTRLSHVLNHQLVDRQPLVVYGSQAEFAQTNVVSGLLPDSVGGVTESSRRRIVMPFAPTMAETDRVLGHEIVHAFQFDIARKHGGGTGQPLWFIEGMAEYLARGSGDPEARLWLRDVARHERLPRTAREAARELSPYQYGHALWSYLANRFGDQIVEAALKPDKKNRQVKARMRAATGEDLETLYADWRRSVYRSSAGSSHQTRKVRLWSDSDTQLGPALSPDGKHAVFFSERDRLSMDLFLADVASERIIRKLATTAASARYDSLQALRSTGAWSPDGQWFAFPAVRRGGAALVLLAMRDGLRDREVIVTQVGQVLSPTWSPDGSSIAFSALSGGMTDLYVMDVGDETVRQLTDDPFADLQPAWSHDGRTIAFVTERYSSDLSTLRFERPRLALLDVATRLVSQLDVGTGGAQFNPQWSADDRQLFFLGDSGDSRNVFRVDVAHPTPHQLTHAATGVSGVTPTSPALTVSGDGSVLAFTLYQDGRPRLAVLDVNEVGGPSAAEAANDANRRPGEATSEAGLVDRLRDDAASGLPDAASIVNRDYASRLSLENFAQPSMSSGSGPFGTYVRGGGAVLFGDMLGERRLGVGVQVGNRLRDAAFEFRFLNQTRRWNWGAVAELEPGVRRYRRYQEIQYESQAALLKESDYLQRMQLRAAAILAYPFNRGLRVEFTGGVRRASYHREVQSQISSAATGRVLARDRVEAAGGEPTTVAEFGVALVHDTTMFGATGPLLGSRYRFEFSPAAGDLTYMRVLADYRRYVMPVRPYSLAVRVLHSARYGPDADDSRLMTSFLGSNYYVRGHRLDLRYCPPDPTRVCGEQLLGSRLLVSNVELRFPLWGAFSRELDYDPVPADVFVFADGGMVWSRQATGISSIGAGVRVNAGGLPFEVAAMRALDGPSPQWHFDFGFRTGF